MKHNTAHLKSRLTRYACNREFWRPVEKLTSCEMNGQSSTSLLIMSRRFLSPWTIFSFPWKIWKVQPLGEPMLAPAKTGAVEDRGGSAMHFDWKNTKPFGDLQHLKLQLIFHYWNGPCWVSTTFFFCDWSLLICVLYDCRLSMLLWPLSWATRCSYNNNNNTFYFTP